MAEMFDGIIIESNTAVDGGIRMVMTRERFRCGGF